MRLRLIPALALAAACSLSGCRQPDGAVPAETGEAPNRISDLRENVENVARGDANAPRELADDLKVFIDNEADNAADAMRAADELARRISTAVKGRAVPEQTGQQIARQLWLTMSARELSERQVDKLQEDLTAALVAVGSPEPSAQAVAEQAAAVQQVLTTRERRWYEFF